MSANQIARPVTIFYSYAPEDELLRNELDKHLSNLRRNGIIVGWYDSQIVAGRNREDAINAHLNTADIILLLISPDFLASDYCFGIEMRRALERHRAGEALVIPVILRPVDWQDSPFADLRCLPHDAKPVTMWSNLDTAFLNIASSIRQVIEAKKPFAIQTHLTSPFSLGERERNRDQLMIVTAPPLPPHMVSRSQELDNLLQIVLNEDINRESGLIAVLGMGGVGKSVLVMELCHDVIVQRKFPDGILWVDMGQEPGSLLMKIHSVERALGRSSGPYVTEIDAIAHLRELLFWKSALIVLDDIWNVEHVKSFLTNIRGASTHSPAGEVLHSRENQSVILFTARDGDIAKELGAKSIQLDVLKPPQAIELLRAWAGRDDPALSKIAHRLGYLPLALKLTGAKLGKGISGQDWLQSYKHVSQLRTNLKPKTTHESVALCFDLSIGELSEEYARLYNTLGIFPANIRLPQQVVKRLWRKMKSDLEEADSDDLLIELERLALIDRSIEDKTISQHTLLHDYSREKLGEHYISTQRELLKAYNSDRKPWWEILHDGYLYFYLAFHLKEAELIDELHKLLTDSPEWMNAKFTACLGDSAYMADLELMLADFGNLHQVDPRNLYTILDHEPKGIHTNKSKNADSPPQFTTDQLLRLVQLQTVQHVLLQRAHLYSDTDLQTLILLEREVEALSYARLRTDHRSRFLSLLCIYQTFKQLRKDPPLLQEEVYEAARSIEFNTDRSIALSQLGLALAQNGNKFSADSAFNESLETTFIIKDDRRRAKALIELVSNLASAGYDEQSQMVLTRSIETIKSIRDNMERGDTLIDLGILLVGLRLNERAASLFTEAAQFISTIDHPSNRLQQLLKLAVSLAHNGYNDQADKLFVETREVISTFQKRTIVFNRQSHEVHEVISQDEVRTASALKDLAIAYAQAKYFTEAFKIADTITEKWHQQYVLRALAGSLADAEKYDEAMQIAYSIEYEQFRSTALAQIAIDMISSGYSGEVDEIISKIPLPKERAKVLSELGLALAKEGHIEQADRIFISLRQIALLTREDESYVQALCKAGRLLAQKGYIVHADLVFEHARKLISTMQPDVLRAEMQCQLANSLGEQGHHEQGNALLSEAIDILSMAASDRYNPASNVLAMAFTLAGRFEEAEQTIQTMHSASLWIGLQDDALSYLISALAQTGQFEEAERIVYENKNSWTFSVSLALGKLGIALALAGHKERAETIFTELSELDLDGQTALLLGQYFNDTAYYEQAERKFTRAIQRTKHLQTIGPWLAAIEGLTTTLVYLGHFIEAFDYVRIYAGNSLDEFLQSVSIFAPAIEQVEQKLSAKVLLEAIRITGWTHPGWREIYEKLTTLPLI